MPTGLQSLWGKLTTNHAFPSTSLILPPVVQTFLTLTSREPTADHRRDSVDPGGDQGLCSYPHTFNHRHSKPRSRNPSGAGLEARGHANGPPRSWAQESVRVWG